MALPCARLARLPRAARHGEPTAVCFLRGPQSASQPIESTLSSSCLPFVGLSIRRLVHPSAYPSPARLPVHDWWGRARAGGGRRARRQAWARGRGLGRQTGTGSPRWALGKSGLGTLTSRRSGRLADWQTAIPTLPRCLPRWVSSRPGGNYIVDLVLQM